jgi:hypothetical protein
MNLPPGLIPLLILPIGATATAIVLLLRARKAERDEVKRIIDSYKIQLTHIELSDRELEYIRLSFFPELENVIRLTQKYSSGFFLVATVPIGATVAGSCVAVLTSGLLSHWAVWGLAAIGLLSAWQAGWTMLNSFVQTGQRYRDAVALRYELEGCITELLAPTPDIPIAKQFDQFFEEFRKIKAMANGAALERIDSAQRASQLIADEAKNQLEQDREQYRARWQDQPQSRVVSDKSTPTIETAITPEFSPIPALKLELIPEVDDRFATVGMGTPAAYVTAQDEAEVPTIGDTGLAVAQYIEMSQSGSDDDDTAVFLNQGGVG